MKKEGDWIGIQTYFADPRDNIKPAHIILRIKQITNQITDQQACQYKHHQVNIKRESIVILE